MSMAIAAGVIGAVGVVGGIVNGAKGSKAASQTGQAAAQTSAIAQGQWNDQQQYNKQLQDLINNPDSFLSSRTFQDSLNQGLTGVSRQMAAQGYLGSGNEMTALTQYGDSFASSQLAQQESLLASLTGLNVNAGSTAAGGAQAAGTAANAQGLATQEGNGVMNSAEGVMGQVSGLMNPSNNLTPYVVTGAGANWM
jgi:hypothetical protein